MRLTTLSPMQMIQLIKYLEAITIFEQGLQGLDEQYRNETATAANDGA